MPAVYSQELRLKAGIDWTFARGLEGFVHEHCDEVAPTSYIVRASGRRFLDVRAHSIDGLVDQLDKASIELQAVDTLALNATNGQQLDLDFELFSIQSVRVLFAIGHPGIFRIISTDEAKVIGLAQLVTERVNNHTLKPLPPKPATVPEPTPSESKHQWWQSVLDTKGLVTTIVGGLVVAVVVYFLLSH